MNMNFTRVLKDKIILLSACFLLQVLPASAQEVVQSGYTTTPLGGVVDARKAAADKWQVIVENKSYELNKVDEDIERVKAEKTRKKQEEALQKFKANGVEGVNGIDTPELRNNFNGITSGAIPYDNGTAIGNGRFVLHSVNSSMAVYDTSGQILLPSTSLSSFFGTTSTISDPRVIYDSYNDRFIMLAIPTNFCAIFIAFSATNDPTGNWYKYTQTIPGEITSSIYDYPYVGISEHELVISGSVFPSSGQGTNVHPNVLQIAKKEGYSGGALRVRNYKLANTRNYSLCVVNHAGPEYTYGNKVYLVSDIRSTAGGDQLNLYTLTDTIGGNPQLTLTAISVPTYTPAGNAIQKGTSSTLSTIDTRVMSAVYANGLIHLVQHGDINFSGYASIIYTRIKTSDNTSQTFNYSRAQSDLTFPSIALFNSPQKPNERNVLIGYQETNTLTYPSLLAVVCKDNGTWSNPVILKTGTGYIFYNRWGDYSSCTRKHNAQVPTAWVSGEYGGTGNKRMSWVAQVSITPEQEIVQVLPQPDFNLFPNPAVDHRFEMVFTLPVEEFIKIVLYDVLGQEVSVLLDAALPAGLNKVSFDKSSLAAGMYYVRVVSPKKVLHEGKLIIK